jgi:hypothetical protein
MLQGEANGGIPIRQRQRSNANAIKGVSYMTSPDNHPIEYKSHAIVDQALVDPAK